METGLTFSADGSGEYQKIINRIIRAAKNLDVAFTDNEKSVEGFEDALKGANTQITSTSRRLNTLIDKFSELDVAVRTVADRIPAVLRELERGLANANLERGFARLGERAADSLIDAIKRELGIRSPSVILQEIGIEMIAGLTLGFGASALDRLGRRSADKLTDSFRDNATDGINRAVDDIERAIAASFGRINQKLNSMGRGLMGAGSGLMGGGQSLLLAGGLTGAATAGGIGLAVNQFATFEDALVNAQSIMGATNEEMALIQEQLLAIGGSSQAGAFQAAESFYAIVSGVQDATIHMDILNASIATSEAGQAELTATTSGLISVMNAYGGENLSAARASDVFSRTVQMGVGTMDQFVSAMSPVGGLANAVGVSFEEMGAAMAFQTAQGATASASATRLQQAMVALLRPNQRMNEALENAGYESGQLAIEQLGLVGALQAVNDGLDGNSAQFAEALGSVEALQGAVALLDDGYAEFADNYAQGLDGATQAAREIQLERTNAAISQLRNSFGALVIEIGAHLAPVIEVLANHLTTAINGVRSFMRNNQELTSIIIRVGSVIGLVVSALLTLAGVIAVVAGASAFLSGGALVGVTSAIGGVVAAIMSPVGMLAALGGIVGYFTILPNLIQATQRQLGRIGQVFGQIGAGINSVMQANGLQVGDRSTESLEQENRLLEQRQDILEDIESLTAATTDQQTVQIEQGDTLWQIAQDQGIALEDLLAANEGIDPRALSVGQTITLPVEIDANNPANKERIAELEGQLSDIDNAIKAVTQQPTLDDLRGDFADIALEAGNVFDGLMQIVGGDFAGGVANIESAFANMGTSLSNVWDTFSSGFASAAPDATRLDNILGIEDAMTSGGGGSPLARRIETFVIDQVQGATDALLAYDFSSGFVGVVDSIKQGLTQAMNTASGAIAGGDRLNEMLAIEDQMGGDQTAAQDFADMMFGILRRGVLLLGGMLGFPVGTVFGIASLVGTIIQNDIAGIGTWLETSGVGHNFTSVKDYIVAEFHDTLDELGIELPDLSEVFTAENLGLANFNLQEVIGGLFGGNGQTPLLDDMGNIIGSPPTAQGNPLQPIIDWFQPFIDNITVVKDTVVDLLPEITDGISGFVTNLSSTIDLEQLMGAGTNIAGAGVGIATFFRDFMQPFIDFSIAGGAAIINGIADALPSLGTTIGEFINSISALLTGDFGGAFTSFINGIVSFGAAILNFSAGAADGILTALENIMGVEIVSVDEGLQGWVDAFTLAWEGVQGIINNIQIGLANFSLGLQSQILTFIADTRQVTLDATFGGLDIAPNVDADLANVQARQAVRDAFASGDTEGAQEAISIATDLGVEVSNIAMQYEGQEGFEGIQSAIATELASAASEGDEEAMQILIPTAVSLGLSDEDVLEEANNAGISIGDEVELGLNSALGIASPSRVAIGIGENVASSMAIGFGRGMPKMQGLINMLIGSIGRIVPAAQAAGQQGVAAMFLFQVQLGKMADAAKNLANNLTGVANAMGNVDGGGGGNVPAPEGRADGGSLLANRFYEITERGEPEVATIGNRTYLFPAQNGFMSPVSSFGGSADAMGGGGSNSVNNSSSNNSITIGEVTFVVPDGIDDPVSFADWFEDAMTLYQESRTIGETMQDTI